MRHRDPAVSAYRWQTWRRFCIRAIFVLCPDLKHDYDESKSLAEDRYCWSLDAPIFPVLLLATGWSQLQCGYTLVVLCLCTCLVGRAQHLILTLSCVRGTNPCKPDIGQVSEIRKQSSVVSYQQSCKSPFYHSYLINQHSVYITYL